MARASLALFSNPGAGLDLPPMRLTLLHPAPCKIHRLGSIVGQRQENLESLKRVTLIPEVLYLLANLQNPRTDKNETCLDLKPRPLVSAGGN